jgi:hypothetical protein
VLQFISLTIYQFNKLAEDNNIEIRSEEVQEIMGTPPKWIVRWGIVIILLVVVILLLGSFYYKYPDIIEARVTVVSQNPPAQIVARSDGKLDQIFVADNQKVEKGELLGIVGPKSILLFLIYESVERFANI